MDFDFFMHRAIELAKKGKGHVNPNPLVGAVIVKNGKIIGEGYHEKYGELHAERNAIANCSESAEDATIFVTLEPCCHYGKTPPCTQAIIENKIARVVIGSKDPNPKVAGKGIEILKNAGIEVVEGVLQEECDQMNDVFFHYITTNMPFVAMKYAMTMDGKIATYTGKSQWITGEKARQAVQESRNRYSSIMVGVGTVCTDDPLLTCRTEGGRNPIRVVCDTNLSIPLSSKIVETAKDVPTIIVCSFVDDEKMVILKNKGCEVKVLPQEDGHVSLRETMKYLAGKNIDSVFLEGGGVLNFSAIKSGLVHKAEVYIAPKIFGGRDAKTPVEGEGVEEVDMGYYFEKPKVTLIGDDVLLEYYKKKGAADVYGHS
ncbi:MAG TPA: bifunctional diaminohydroxyphosphoribosylaminopyrimidine deaminase/5-amino-6-(5-phosphoribosylamino)uracil reductase RibD [Lachnospiraceae bacterium]|nr:bifunctional diaminohydroxyphosphoribosylaminopyrimidine deaminase/5-amino-6-(5-phosphoribosylamino)uracil reductase RibD [Lachnospiraceae bacterium]